LADDFAVRAWLFIAAIWACCALLSGQNTAAPDAYSRGKAALDAKRYAEAESALAEAEAASPGNTNALALRAKALIHLNEFEQARSCLNNYLRVHSKSADAKYLLGYVLFRLNKPSESLAIYTSAAVLQRPTPDDFKIVGLDYVLLNDYLDAVRWLERSVSEAPNDAESLYYLGRAYYVQNAFDKAIAAFHKALELKPDDAKAENNLGLALEGKNELEAAESAYRKAIRMGEDLRQPNAEPYTNLAELLSHGERDREALSLVEEAEHLGGKTARTEQIRGQILTAQNKLPQAEAAFRAALAVKPENGALHYLLARVLKREGKLDDAEKEFAASKALTASRSATPN
jgi:tetratricopeptide (TPR) repeat protein